LEIASQLESRGTAVHHVIMLDTPEPRFYQRSFTLWPTLQKKCRKNFSFQRLRSVSQRLLGSWRSSWLRSPAAIQTRKIQQHHEARKRENFKHYKEVMGGFQPQKPKNAAVYLLRATRQDLDPTWSKSPDYGWASVIPDIQVVNIAGGHVSMLELGQVESLADHINQILSKAPKCPSIATIPPSAGTGEY
jgi:thioesterase domain-containing protein